MPLKEGTRAINPTLLAPGTFGWTLRQHRLVAGLTQEELAARSGLSVRAIRDLERDRSSRPYPRSVRLLADALKLTGIQVMELHLLARGGGVTAGTGLLVPSQLPTGVAQFVGRERELIVLDELLGQADQSSSGATMMVAAIGGTAGVGKTALALHWAHRVAERFTDGQLYANLGGFGPAGEPADPTAVIGVFLEALGILSERIPASPEARAGLYRSLLAGKRLLILLDNAGDAGQVRPLLPGAPGCLVLVTSRAELTGLAADRGACLITLSVPSETDARKLLARRLGPERAAAEPAAISELVSLCARLPLALAVAAARAAARPRFPLAALAAELRDAAGRLEVLDCGDAAASVRAVFSWSYQQLTGPGARMFRLLGLHPGPDVSVPAAASLAGAHAAEAHRMLAELTHLRLLTEHTPGRYAFHDLLRTYAAGQARARDRAPAQRAALHRVLDHYLRTASAAAALVDPFYDPPSLEPPPPGAVPEALASYEEAWSWFNVEHEVLLVAIRRAAETGFDAYAWQLPLTLTDFCYMSGHWAHLVANQQIALAAAERLGGPAAQARTRLDLARSQYVLGRHQEAGGHIRHALTLFKRLGDLTGQARCHHAEARSCELQHRYLDALNYARQGLAQFRAAGHRPGQARALNLVGWLNARIGDDHQAIAYCQQALTLCREIGYRDQEAGTWDSLGYAQGNLGRHADAAASYQNALRLFRQLGNRYHEADTLSHLADTHRAAGQEEQAQKARQQAIDILKTCTNSAGAAPVLCLHTSGIYTWRAAARR